MDYVHGEKNNVAVGVDAIGTSLRNSMIWIPLEAEERGKAMSVAFRKPLEITEPPVMAKLHIFADSRYVLWINGQYILRGPSRFHPKRPEYDTVNVRDLLRKGLNTLAVLVHSCQFESRRFMEHAPGLALRLEVKDGKGNILHVITDSSWRGSHHTRFLPPHNQAYACIVDYIDATCEKGDWLLPDFDDSTWALVIHTDGSQWGPFYPRSIPLLRETEIPPAAIVQVRQGDRTDNSRRPLPKALPLEVSALDELVIDVGRYVLAYYVIDFEAAGGSQLQFKPRQTRAQREANFLGECNCKARAGRQTYMSTDTYGFRYLHIQVDSGRIRLYGIRIVNRLYPFDCLGRFHSTDPMLNELWEMAVLTRSVNSEDGCVDGCERGEWMTASYDYPPIRVAFAGPGQDGAPYYSDPRLIGNMLRRLALTQEGDDLMLACSPSGCHLRKENCHAVIEDSACEWVHILRQYYEITGKDDLVRELWPVLAKQIKWFLDRRTKRGLVHAREWFLHFDNPISFQMCEGTTLNAYIYQMFEDAACLARILGRQQHAGQYADAAASLHRDFNRHLWDATSGTYYAGIQEGKKAPSQWTLCWEAQRAKAYFAGIKPGQKEFPPTIQAALMALNRGLVPPERLEPVRRYLLAHCGELNSPFAHQFLFEELYKMNSEEMDLRVLQIIRTRWEAMVRAKDPGTLRESFSECQYVCHQFGPIPAFFLSAYVLGVRSDGPVWNKRLIIEPRLGDLKEAEGVVVTEHGPVPVSWKKNDGDRSLSFSFEIPSDVKARVFLPMPCKKPTLLINGKTLLTQGKVRGQVALGDRFVAMEIGSGEYSGRIMP